MKDLQQRLQTLSREKQSLLVAWLRTERGAARQPSVQEAAAPLQERPPAAPPPRPQLPSPEELEGLSNEEVDALLSEMLAAEASAEPAAPVPRTAGPGQGAGPEPDPSSMSDDEVAAMLAELLQQEDPR